jgi:hypothetical protein
MELTIDTILLALAFVCFVVAAAGVPTKLNLVPLGLGCWVLSLLV